MKVILFGATGMVGQGVLRECLLDPGIEMVLSIGRSPSRINHAKFREIVHRDLWDYRAIEPELAGLDACFFCLGVASAGTSDADYERITYGIPVAAGEVLARLNRGLTFVFISGMGADSTEKGRVAWARVKGRAENALLRMPFRAVYVFRPAIIQPLHGIQSRTAAYRWFYKLAAPVMPVFRSLLRGWFLTTEELGRAAILVAREGAPKHVLESQDIRHLLPYSTGSGRR